MAFWANQLAPEMTPCHLTRLDRRVPFAKVGDILGAGLEASVDFLTAGGVDIVIKRVGGDLWAVEGRLSVLCSRAASDCNDRRHRERHSFDSPYPRRVSGWLLPIIGPRLSCIPSRQGMLLSRRLVAVVLVHIC
jgi:hypothetical protein